MININSKQLFDFNNEKDDKEITNVTKIKVFGVGGGGGNAVTRMASIKSASINTSNNVDFIIANTDLQVLKGIPADKIQRLQIGNKITKGLGAGANPEVGRRAALEDKDQLHSILKGSDMVFITAGMGGGTGTGAAPVIASVSKEMGILTVAVVTKPFNFEGTRRMQQAEQGIRELRENVDSLIVIPNQNLLRVADKNTELIQAFTYADDVLKKAVQGIADLIIVPGHINVDFADVRTIMKGKGDAIMGIGYGEGENRALEAAQKAIKSELLDSEINGADGILINISGNANLGIREINSAVTLIEQAASENANIIFGTSIDESLKDYIKITVIATGVGANSKNSQPQNIRTAEPIRKSSDNNNIRQTEVKTSEKKPFGNLNLNGIRPKTELHTPSINR